ncbi:MAG: endoribonuclease MazF [Thermoanaerobaculia bacterium]
MAYAPKRGDVVWITLQPQAGHEQAGRRPALVVSPLAYNKKVGLALLCPMTRQAKGYPFEVVLPDGLPARGVILADQVKSLDWRARRAEYFCTLDGATTSAVIERIERLLEDRQEGRGPVG